MRYGLNYVRSVVGELFYRFGIHCATHQIRVILICAVIITSLFYPALALYNSSQPLSSLSARLSAYYLPNRADASALADLQEIWQVYDGTLSVMDDADSRLRCGLDTTVRLERVAVPSVHRREDGALNQQTLEAALELERQLESLLSADGAPECVKSRERPGKCMVLSPLLYWQHNRDLLSHDTHPVVTINTQRNVSVDGFAVTPETVIAGLMSEGAEKTEIAQAELLVLSYFFWDDICEANEAHAAWSQLLQAAVGDSGTIRTTRSQQSTLLPLQFRSSSASSRLSIISVFLYLTYFAVFINFSGSMRSVNTVHSRVGLAFTGVVEIIASTITSVSVLALWGFRITLVPWGVLPLIMVFVGAENMLFMINAVVKTNVHLPVKERIALGVSEAGTSNTLKAVTYNSVLGSLAFFAGRGAIRQFCVFAIVVLVAHWFLIHTLFLTVLSIDLQRLELSEVLSQDPGLSPKSAIKKRGTSVSRQRTGTETVQRLVKSRATKDGSLLLILLVTLILYYVTYPNTTQLDIEPDPFARQTQRTMDSKVTPGLRLWETLNPQGKKLVHMRIEPPSLVQFAGAGSASGNASTPEQQPPQPRRLVSSKQRMLWWATKIVLLPIAGTVGLLYGLLAYLLKNSELLEMQHGAANGHAGNGTAGGAEREDHGFGAEAKFATLPRAFASDVEMVAVAKDGTVCAAVSSDNVLAVWSPGDVALSTVDVGEARGSASCVALDSQGSYVCVGTSTGAVALWRVTPESNAVVTVGTFALNTEPTGVQDLGFVRHLDDSLSIVATYESGTVLEWDCVTGTPTPIQPTLSTSSIVRASLLHDRSRDLTAVACVLISGTIEILDCLKGPGAWTTTSSIEVEPAHEAIVSVGRTYFDLQNSGSRLVIATLSRLGALRLWDGHTGESIARLGNMKMMMGDDEVVQLHLAGLQAETTACERCREQAEGGFSLALCVSETVFVYRSLVGERCACALAGNGAKPPGPGRRSRAGSAAPSPLRSRLPARMPLDYPISGHGYHSRRSSHKDESRRTLTVDDDGYIEPNGDATPSGRWKDLSTRCIAEVPCERGAWAALDGSYVVGIRRRARGAAGQGPFAPPVTGSAGALSAAVLQRWEAWSLDTSQLVPSARASTLYSLSEEANTSDSARPSRTTSRQSSISSLKASTSTLRPPPASHQGSQQSQSSVTDGLYPRLPFTRASCLRAVKNQCFVGLGNTLGVLQFDSRPPTSTVLKSTSTATSSPALSRRGSVGASAAANAGGFSLGHSSVL